MTHNPVKRSELVSAIIQYWAWEASNIQDNPWGLRETSQFRAVDQIVLDGLQQLDSKRIQMRDLPIHLARIILDQRHHYPDSN